MNKPLIRSKITILFIIISIFFFQSINISGLEKCDLFSDSFERNEIGVNWTIIDDAPTSDWKIVNGKLYQGSNNYRSDREYEFFQGTKIIVGDSKWSDYTISFDLTSTDDDGIGAIFKYQDNNNYLRFIMVRDPSNRGQFRRIDKIVDGKPPQILAIDDKNSFEINKTYKIKIEVFGSSIKVFMDNAQILSAEDSTFKTGKVGLMTYASQGYFDNFCVSSKNDNSSTKNEDKPSSEVLTIILQIDNPYMIVNGVKKEIDPGRGTVPVIIKGRTLVPIRAIIEEMGGEIFWDGGERKVTIKLRATTIELWIDKKSARVNGISKALDVPPTILNGRTMLPLRFVTENLGCDVKWDGTTKTVTIKYDKRLVASEINKISSEGEKVIGPQGGELTLSDGTTLIIPQNSFKEDSKIKLTSIINPNFSSVDTLGFEILGLNKLSGEITLKFTAEKGLNNDEYDVYGYIEEKDERFEVASNYDPNSGLVNVKIKNQTQNIIYPFWALSSKNIYQSMGDKIWIYFGWSKYYTPKSNDKIMEIPYYEQTGGSCASTCTQMLLKAYGINHIKLPLILSKINANDEDFGVGANIFAGQLRDFISSETGYPVVHIPNWSITHLKWRILQELDKGHPVILSYPCKYPDSCKSGHVILIIGYRNNGSELVIHDPGNISPKDVNDGTMYTIRDWNWIETRRTTELHRYQILYIDGPHSSQNFITLTLPSNDETGAMCNGDLSFRYLNTKTNKYETLNSLQIKPSIKSDGLVWVDKTYKEIEAIPQEADILNIKFFTYNSVFDAKNVEIITSIVHNNGTLAGGKVISQNKKQLNLPSATFNNNSRGEYTYEYKLEDIRDLNLSNEDGYLNIYIRASLFDGTTVKDSFEVKAKIDIKPKVTSISPESGSEGDKITINGYAFGKTKSKNSKVTINNLDTEILSWSDKKIEIKIPKGVTSGPVVVYNGENFTYKSNDNVYFNLGKLVCEGRYLVTSKEKIPSFDERTCKWLPNSNSFDIFLTLKDGKVICTPPSSNYEASGSYDDNGNITFTFTWKSDISSSMPFGKIITGTFTGKFIKKCYFSGIAKGKVREYNNNNIGSNCVTFDVTMDFTATMYSFDYIP